MPNVSEYETGYGLRQGMTIANYQLTHLTIQHKQVTRWNEYAYPTNIQFVYKGSTPASAATMQQLFVDFTKQVSGVRIIYTEKGTPYKCLFQYPSTAAPTAEYSEDYRTIDLVYHGYAKRVGGAEAAAIKAGKQGW